MRYTAGVGMAQATMGRALTRVHEARWGAVDAAPVTAAPAAPSNYHDWLASTLPKGWTADAAHIRLIAEHLDAVERGEIDRLAIHMPPRHGKSETVTYRFPVRWLQQHPSDNVLVTGYNERFARKFGRRTRNLARQLGIAGEKAAADEWETTGGGMLMARGVGSPPTGTGFHGILIDDPVRRREDADSETYREKTWDWFSDDLYTRLEPGGWIVLIMTLWHEADIGAQIVASEPGQWTILKLPAFAVEGDLLGRPVGAPLWPERFPAHVLERRRMVMTQDVGERSWQAIYQQNPTPREGAFFKVTQFNFAKAAPAGLKCVRGWDLGSSSKGDYSVGVKIGTDGERYYVQHVTRGQWLPDDRNKAMKQASVLDGPAVRIHLPADPGQASKDQVLTMTRLLAGYSVIAEPVTGSKEVRADGWATQINAGNVWLIDDGTWDMKAFIEEHRTFPLGKHDDQVDAAADAFTELALPKASLEYWTV